MAEKQLTYFISDLHLGMHPPEESREREKLFVNWLDEIGTNAKELWLLGDIFDYWFEYRKVVPRGFTRSLGKLAQLNDSGIEIHMIPGNHDIWIFDYLPEEIGLQVHKSPEILELGEKKFHLGHGDGLHRGDTIYRFLQALFHNKVLQWLYARIHPNGSMALAHWWSRKSRLHHGITGRFEGIENEHQVLFARNEILKDPSINYFIFGHRHVPFDIHIAGDTRVICLGDWIGNFTYGVFDGNTFTLKRFLEDRGEIIRLDATL